MGFNRRKMEDERRRIAAKEAASRRATDAQVLEDASTKELLERRAAEEGRSVTNYLESLIVRNGGKARPKKPKG